MATLPTPAAACNAVGQVEGTLFLTAVPQPATSPDLSAIAAPTVIDHIPASDVLRSTVADAIPLLRQLLQIEEWEECEDYSEGVAIVNRLELLSCAVPTKHSTPVVTTVSPILREAAVEAVTLARSVIATIQDEEDDTLSAEAALNRLDLLLSSIPSEPANPEATPAVAVVTRAIDEMATAEAWYADADAAGPKAQAWWASAPDDAEKRCTALRVARQLVLAHSPIGRAAAKIADLADQLDDALTDFLTVDVRGCVAQAFGETGLLDDRDEDAWQRNCFDVFAETARGYAYLIGQMAAVFQETGGRLGEAATTGITPVWREAA